jgi:hypothetical protein
MKERVFHYDFHLSISIKDFFLRLAGKHPTRVYTARRTTRLRMHYKICGPILDWIIAGIVRGWGMDSVWEQEKLEARKMLLNRARPSGSPTRQVHALLGGVLCLPVW